MLKAAASYRASLMASCGMEGAAANLLMVR